MSDKEIGDFLEHHGIKGMKWGVHRNSSSENPSSSSSGPDNPPSNHKKLKTAGIVLGSAAGIALIAAGSYYVAKNGGLPLSSIKSSDIAKGRSAAEGVISSIHEEPTSPILATTGKHIGNGFLMKGGLADPLHEYDKAGFSNGLVGVGEHRIYGGKVAVSFHDPKGRKDQAGRPIVHEVIIPRHHSTGVNSYESAREKAWALIKNTYDPFYEISTNPNPKQTRIS